MGGALILVAVTAGTLLWAELSNRFVWIALTVLFVAPFVGVDHPGGSVRPDGVASRPTTKGPPP